jgi:hypothetical protein
MTWLAAVISFAIAIYTLTLVGWFASGVVDVVVDFVPQ